MIFLSLFRVDLEDHYFGLIYQFVDTKNDTFTTIQPTNKSIPWVVSRKTCIIVFTILTILIIISAFTEVVFLVSICTTASLNLYNRMYNSITRATIAFLNKNPSGR